MTTDHRTDSLLSVSQYAARVGVSRARVLQLIATRRIAGARRIGHAWTIPASARFDRRAPGRPARSSAAASARMLGAMAKKYVWWLSRAEAIERPDLVAIQVMELGDYDDVCRFEAALGRDALVRALSRPEASRLSARSWTFWHFRLGLSRAGRVPAQPRRNLR